MIQISNVPLSPDCDFSNLPKLIAKITGLPQQEITNCRLTKKSVDARKKPDVVFVCTFIFETRQEEKAIKKIKHKQTTLVRQQKKDFPIPTCFKKTEPTVIVGCGPAGLFAGLILARAGADPILIDRGESVEQRIKTVSDFWEKGLLNPQSNVQFGEGGAGTFSDGKLNTGTKDPRNRFVLETFVEHGAPEEVLCAAKPHVGTDRLVKVVRSIREEIFRLGGQVLFSHQLTDLVLEKGRLQGIEVTIPCGKKEFPCRRLILALGHSARDTAAMLLEKGITMEQKAFSLGVRIEHPQSLINFSQYGDRWSSPPLPTAEYKLSTHLPDGRGVYTFCMCPGGQVVASASQPGGVCTNGMSLFARDGKNANSGLLVGVNPADFGSDHPLAGMKLQETIEKAAFASAGSNYYAPVQLVGDFLKNQSSCALGEVEPTYQPGVTFCKLEEYLPSFVTHSLRNALPMLGQKLKGFDRADAVLTGPETRSSSPVRMSRNETYQSNIAGVYPCGEGAGYAGGITSAAADGIRVAMAILAE
ncbi:MAG: FAD-dependent monooxygenase [Clostridia bacterium]|nr:FAD-dependent monooxygenase [Clostridia bacterium]